MIFKTYCVILFIIIGAEVVVPWINSNRIGGKKRVDLKQFCPEVKAIRNFEIEEVMGQWYVVQYYASTEELPEYACMRSHFAMEDQRITMNFTYVFTEDPLREKLQGNITWTIPDFDAPAHWMHIEDIYEGIYNTYVLDTDYISWALIMHCAEKLKYPRYLSALLLSREPQLGDNVISREDINMHEKTFWSKEKLPRYDIDLSFMFPIKQSECDNLMESAADDPLAYRLNNNNEDTTVKTVILKN